MAYAHKGEILPLVNQMIPIDKQTTFHASYDHGLHGMNQDNIVNPIGPEVGTVFSGSNNDIITLPFGNGWNPMTTPITIELWAKASTTTSRMVFGPTNGSTERFYIGAGNAGKWEIGVQGTSWGGGTVTVTTEWTHLKMIAANGAAILYVDGIESDRIDYTSYNITSNFGVGGMYGGGYAWNGLLADLKIYINDTLHAHYKLNGNEGKIVHDASGNGNEGVRISNLTSTYGPTVTTLKKEEEGKFRGAVTIEPETTNLFINPTLSSDASDWVQRDVTLATHHDSLEINTTTATAGIYQNIPGMITGDTYTISYWYKLVSGSRNIGGHIDGYSAGNTKIRIDRGGWVAGTVTQVPDDGEYHFVEEQHTCPSDGSKNVWIQPGRSDSAVTTGILRIGNGYGIQIEKRDSSTSFVDGSRPLGKLWYPKELVNPNSFTLSCWFNIPYVHRVSTNNTGIQGNWYHPIIELAPTTNSGTIGYSIAVEPDTGAGFRSLRYRMPNVSSDKKIQDEQWYHLVATWDGTTHSLFLDGELAISTTAFHGDITNSVLMMGGGYYGKPFIKIDEVRIESRAISADEAAAWAASGLHYNYLDYSYYVD